MPLANEGAAVASTLAKAAAGADFVITMLATPEAFEQVLFGSGGLATALSPGQVLIDMSTVGPDEVRSAAARLPEGTSLVDAPVRGTQVHTRDGVNSDGVRIALTRCAVHNVPHFPQRVHGLRKAGNAFETQLVGKPLLM